MNSRARIAINLRRIRVGKGLSQEALGDAAKIDRTYISGIERRSFNPTVDVLDRLSKVLKIDVTELLAVPESSATPRPLPAGRKATRPKRARRTG